MLSCHCSFQNFAHPGRFLGRFGAGTEFAPFVTLSLGVEFVVIFFVADAKVIPEGWVVTSPCRHEFALHVSVCVFSTSGESHGGFLIVLDM